MIAILRVRFTSNTDPNSTWSDASFENWMHPALTFSLGNYWWVSGWGSFDLTYKLFPEIVIDDPRATADPGTPPRDALVSGCINNASAKLGLSFDEFDLLMIWFAQATDMFGGGTYDVPLASGDTKSIPVTVVDVDSWFSGCCQELGHSYGFNHELSASGKEYGSPYSAMSARGDLEFLRPEDPRLPKGGIIQNPGDPYVGNDAQRVIGPSLPAAQLYAFDWFRNSPHVNRVVFDAGRRSPVLTLYALDYARDHSQESQYLALVVIAGYSGRRFALELRRQQGFDQGVTPGIVVHSFEVDGSDVTSSRINYEAAAPLPSDSYIDWPFPLAPFTARLLETAPDNSFVRLQVFQGTWDELDDNSDTVDIVADGADLYQIHRTGRIWKYTGVPHTGWLELDNNGDSVKIAASGGNLYQLHRTGRIWKYTGTPHTGWDELDNNGDTVDIVADGADLYQIHRTGKIWKYTGVPHTGWVQLDSDPASKQIAAAGGKLFQLHSTGRIWRYLGILDWFELDHNPASSKIVAAPQKLYQLHNSGRIWSIDV